MGQGKGSGWWRVEGRGTKTHRHDLEAFFVTGWGWGVVGGGGGRCRRSARIIPPFFRAEGGGSMRNWGGVARVLRRTACAPD